MSADVAVVPAGYKGLYAFHKNWGKKPHEILGFLVETLSEPGSVVVDPFVGSGACARETVTRGRRFVGIDINPLAFQLSELMVSPPLYSELKSAMKTIEKECRDRILASYVLEDTSVADVAAVLSVTPKAVEGRLFQARRRLRQRLDATPSNLQIVKAILL